MANESATTRLLFAILRQRCLKDLDWNKVAHDPILAQEITNGHAARMRYSRFKKQMEGTNTVPRKSRKQRENNSNNHNSNNRKVEKSRSPKKKNVNTRGREQDYEDDEDDEEEHRHPEQIKSEFRTSRYYENQSRARNYENGPGSRSYNSQAAYRHTSGRETQTPEMEGGLASASLAATSSRIKPEPGLSSSNMTPINMPTTPLSGFATPDGGYSHYGHDQNHSFHPGDLHLGISPSPSPNASFGHEHYGEVDEFGLVSSFGMPGGSGGMSPCVPGNFYAGDDSGAIPSDHGYGLDVGFAGSPPLVGLRDLYSQHLENGHRSEGSLKTPVKSEPRWEEGYVHTS